MISMILSIIALYIMYINLQLAHENAPFLLSVVILCPKDQTCGHSRHSTHSRHCGHSVVLCLSSYVSLTRQAHMPRDVRLSRLCGRTYLLQKRKRKSWTASGVGQSRSDGRILHNLRYAKQMSAPSYKPEWVDHLVRRGLPIAVGPSERADRLIQGWIGWPWRIGRPECGSTA